MNIESIRRVWKKAVPFAFAAVVLGAAGSAIAHKIRGRRLLLAGRRVLPSGRRVLQRCP